MTFDIIGSWFPTGYHGHFRSKSRNDVYCEYRHLAKPQPPERFFSRSIQPVSKHAFSHHDNRESFLNDGLYFEQGLGRRRFKNTGKSFTPDFVAWIPEKEYVEKNRPLTSTYRVDFNGCDSKAPQLIVKRPKTSFDNGGMITTYRYVYGKDAPNRKQINALNNRTLLLTNISKQQRETSGRLLRSKCTETVASCLNWYVPPSKPASDVPMETQTEKTSDGT